MMDCRDKSDELRNTINCAEISLEGKRERIALLERVLADWLDTYDTPEQWMRCRNNAKLALGRDAEPKEYLWSNLPQQGKETK